MPIKSDKRPGLCPGVFHQLSFSRMKTSSASKFIIIFKWKLRSHTWRLKTPPVKRANILVHFKLQRFSLWIKNSLFYVKIGKLRVSHRYESKCNFDIGIEKNTSFFNAYYSMGSRPFWPDLVEIWPDQIWICPDLNVSNTAKRPDLFHVYLPENLLWKYLSL